MKKDITKNSYRCDTCDEGDNCLCIWDYIYKQKKLKNIQITK